MLWREKKNHLFVLEILQTIQGDNEEKVEGSDKELNSGLSPERAVYLYNVFEILDPVQNLKIWF